MTGDYETNDLRARRTMALRRGKPAREFRGTWYRPGEPIDPADPNLADPALRKHLEPARRPWVSPRPAAEPEPEPEPQPTPEDAAPADPPLWRHDRLDDEDDDEQEI